MGEGKNFSAPFPFPTSMGGITGVIGKGKGAEKFFALFPDVGHLGTGVAPQARGDDSPP